MRITGGEYRNRKVGVVKGQAAVRPTSEKMRQAIFNLLAHSRWGMDLNDAVVIDGFCGSGIMGIECLSRGARHIHFIDKEPRVLSALIQTLDSLNLEKTRDYTTHKLDLTKIGPLLRGGNAQADLVFLDPPYHKQMIAPCLALLGDLMKPDAICLFEAEKVMEMNGFPDYFIQEDERAYGDSKLVALRYIA